MVEEGDTWPSALATDNALNLGMMVESVVTDVPNEWSAVGGYRAPVRGPVVFGVLMATDG